MSTDQKVKVDPKLMEQARHIVQGSGGGDVMAEYRNLLRLKLRAEAQPKKP